MFVLTLMMFSGTVMGTSLFHFEEPVALGAFFRVAINGSFLAGAVGAIALLAGAICRERQIAVGVSVAFLVISYFVDLISKWWPWAKPLGPFSLMHYVDVVQIFPHF